MDDSHARIDEKMTVLPAIVSHAAPAAMMLLLNSTHGIPYPDTVNAAVINTMASSFPELRISGGGWYCVSKSKLKVVSAHVTTLSAGELRASMTAPPLRAV